MSADQQAIMPPRRPVSGPFKRRPAGRRHQRKMHYGTFHQGTPRVLTPASTSDFDIYISANDVSGTHFHIYAYKYTARSGRHASGMSTRRTAVSRATTDRRGKLAGNARSLEKDINPRWTSGCARRSGIVQFEWHRGACLQRLIVALSLEQ